VSLCVCVCGYRAGGDECRVLDDAGARDVDGRAPPSPGVGDVTSPPTPPHAVSSDRHEDADSNVGSRVESKADDECKGDIPSGVAVTGTVVAPDGPAGDVGGVEPCSTSTAVEGAPSPSVSATVVEDRGVAPALPVSVDSAGPTPARGERRNVSSSLAQFLSTPSPAELAAKEAEAAPKKPVKKASVPMVRITVASPPKSSSGSAGGDASAPSGGKVGGGTAAGKSLLLQNIKSSAAAAPTASKVAVSMEGRRPSVSVSHAPVVTASGAAPPRVAAPASLVKPGGTSAASVSRVDPRPSRRTSIPLVAEAPEEIAKPAPASTAHGRRSSIPLVDDTTPRGSGADRVSPAAPVEGSTEPQRSVAKPPLPLPLLPASQSSNALAVASSGSASDSKTVAAGDGTAAGGGTGAGTSGSAGVGGSGSAAAGAGSTTSTGAVGIASPQPPAQPAPPAKPKERLTNDDLDTFAAIMGGLSSISYSYARRPVVALVKPAGPTPAQLEEQRRKEAAEAEAAAKAKEEEEARLREVAAKKAAEAEWLRKRIEEVRVPCSFCD
jgi:hypothetical protein